MLLQVNLVKSLWVKCFTKMIYHTTEVSNNKHFCWILHYPCRYSMIILNLLQIPTNSGLNSLSSLSLSSSAIVRSSLSSLRASSRSLRVQEKNTTNVHIVNYSTQMPILTLKRFFKISVPNQQYKRKYIVWPWKPLLLLTINSRTAQLKLSQTQLIIYYDWTLCLDNCFVLPKLISKQ